MTFNINDWKADWVSFEHIINSAEPSLQQAWHESAKAARRNPLFALMMLGGAQRFWRKACTTSSKEHKAGVGGWHIEALPDNTATIGMRLTWLDTSSKPLGTYDYVLAHMLQRGLEGKQCYVFHALDGVPSNPFNVLIAMDPMPERAALAHGGLLSHTHFQYASSEDKLIVGTGSNAKLRRRMWYPTMCAAEGTLLDQCNIVRSLHHLLVWSELPC